MNNLVNPIFRFVNILTHVCLLLKFRLIYLLSGVTLNKYVHVHTDKIIDHSFRKSLKFCIIMIYTNTRP